MKFIALGATDNVGASCYFLQVDGMNLLLDCGKGIIGGNPNSRKNTFGPDFTSLLSGVLTSISQLDAILISHGHYDHVGYLPEIVQQCPNTPVYATYLTQKLGYCLMLDSFCTSDDVSLEKEIGTRLEICQSLERIHSLGYLQPIRIGSLQVTFFEAGHVPGAAMILIESKHEGSFLYTGDFRKQSSRLTPGYVLPQKVRVDHLLLCGLHAKHPRYVVSSGLDSIISAVREADSKCLPCLIQTRELTKGLEIVSFLTDRMNIGDLAPAPIWIDDRIWMLHERIQEVGISVLNEQCYRFPRFFAGGRIPPGIYIGEKKYSRFFESVIDVSFTLHEDFSGCSALIDSLDPRTVLVVHSPADSYLGRHGNTALAEKYPNRTIIYPEIGRQYHL